MTHSRLALTGAVILCLLAAAWLLFSRSSGGPVGDGGGPAATPGAESPAPASGAVGELTPPAATTTGRELVAPAIAPSYEVSGCVLAEPGMAVAGAEVIATRGQAGDQPGLMSTIGAITRSTGNLSPADLPILARGEVLARATVAADGSFTLRADSQHLRLSIEHDYYGLPMPRIVHVPATTGRAEVVLAPYLGGCLRGRLVGGDVAAVRALQLSLQPDPFSVMRDPQGFLGAILAHERGDAKPAADGTFVFRAVMAGATLTVSAEGDTVAGRVVQPALQPGELREFAVPLLAAAVLAVRVTDETAAPVQQARVRARPAEVQDEMTREATTVRGRADAEGAVVLRGLLPGRYQLRAEAAGFVTATSEVVVPDVAEASLRLLRGGSVRGIVVAADGAPVAAAKVAAVPAMKVPMLGDLTAGLGVDLASRAAADGVPTDADGHFTLTGIEGDEPFHVVAQHREHAGGIAENVQAGATDVRIEMLPGNSVRGRVVADEDGAPLGAFTVELQATMFLAVQRPVASADVNASADGTFELRMVPPGSYTLVARADGRSERSAKLTVTAGAEVTAPELRLSRGAIVRGIVRGDHGQPVARAQVRQARGGLLDNPMIAMLQGVGVTAYTDAAGRFELVDLPSGRLQLLAQARGYAGGKSERLTLAAGALLENIEIALAHGGSVAGTLRVGPGERAEDFVIMAQEVQTQHTVSTAPAADGTFRIADLDPGRYQVQAMHPSLLSAMQRPHDDPTPGRGFDFKELMSAVTENIVSQRCVVRDGETTTVDLDASELGTGIRLSLRVLVGGQPLRDGLIEATQVEDGRLHTGFLDDGAATLGALQPGRLRVQVRAGMTMAPVGEVQDLELPAGSSDLSRTIELPGGELRGRVVGMQDGEPLGAVLVRLLRDGLDDDLLGAAITDDGGRFAFQALAPGSYDLIAADALVRPGEAPAASRRDGVQVGAGEVVTGIELRAQPAAGVTIVVTDDVGAPQPGAMLLAVDADGRPLGASPIAVSGADGRAHLGGLPRGRLRVVGRAPGLAPDATALVEVLPGEAIELPLRLRRGTRVVVDAVTRDGRPLLGADVAARCGNGPWFPALLLLEGRAPTGRLELGRLAPGDWEFRIAHPAVATFTVRRSVGDGATVTILAMPQ